MRPPFIKQILDLHPEDFEKHPIWICAYNADIDEPLFEEDPADEATYRPWLGKPPMDVVASRERSIRVASVFTLADGTSLKGMCKPPNPQFGKSSWDIIRIQPAIFYEEHSFWFWLGAATENMIKHRRDALYSAFQRTPEQIFPIRFVIPKIFVSSGSQGQIDGFGWLLAPDFRQTMIGR